jgi:hypothetical protein
VISAAFNLNGQVVNGVFTANMPLYNLAPGNTAALFYRYLQQKKKRNKNQNKQKSNKNKNKKKQKTKKKKT